MWQAHQSATDLGEKAQPCQHLDFGLLGYETVKLQIAALKPFHDVVCVIAALANEDSEQAKDIKS